MEYAFNLSSVLVLNLIRQDSVFRKLTKQIELEKYGVLFQQEVYAKEQFNLKIEKGLDEKDKTC